MNKDKNILKEHNIVPYEKIVNRFKTENKCAIVHATGTGKTFLGLQLAIDNPDKKVLFVVPKLAIKEHIENTIDTLGIDDEEFENTDSAEEIIAVAKEQGINIENVKFVTYQSLTTKDIDQMQKIDADFIIFDEMHHLGAEHWGNASRLLVNTHPNAKVLGMSAFDVWAPGNNFAGYKIATTEEEQEALNGIESEIEPFFPGAVVSKIDIADAIMQGILPEPKYYIGLELFEEIEELNQTKKNLKTDSKEYKEIDSILNEYNNIAKESEKSDNISIYSSTDVYSGYTPRIFNKQALRFLESKLTKNTNAIYFSKKGNIPNTTTRYLDKAEEFCREHLNTSFISFKTTADDPYGKSMRNAFSQGKDILGISRENEAKIMFAIDQYGEGTHIKNVNMAILDKKTASPIVWAENIGRALHSITSEDKPEIIDLAGNVDLVLNVIDKIKTSGQGQFNRNNTKLKSIFGLTIKDIDLLKRLQETKERLNNFLQSDCNWNISFNKFKDFLAEKGRYPSAYSKNDEEQFLAGWTHTQRRKYNAKTLNKEREKQLSDFGFIWDAHEQQWQEMFVKFQKFLAKNSRYPSGASKDDEEKKIGKWVNNQRQSYKNMTLSKEREKQLGDFGFIWDALEQQWQEMFVKFQKFLAKNGRYPSAESSDAEEKKLGTWVQTQRAAVKKGKLSLVRYKMLRRIKFVFDSFDTVEEKNQIKANKEFFENADGMFSR